jgi:hypothetical protein
MDNKEVKDMEAEQDGEVSKVIQGAMGYCMGSKQFDEFVEIIKEYGQAAHDAGLEKAAEKVIEYCGKVSTPDDMPLSSEIAKEIRLLIKG